jgi:hypothetical protein
MAASDCPPVDWPVVDMVMLQGLRRAERRTGELLKELPRSTPADAGRASGIVRSNSPNDAERSPYAQAVADTNVSTQAASK